MRLFINKFVNKSINFKKLYGKNKKSVVKYLSNLGVCMKLVYILKLVLKSFINVRFVYFKNV